MNPDGQPLDGNFPHKHFPTTNYPLPDRRHGASYAYLTYDINPEGSLGDILIAFARECGIEIPEDLRFQLGLSPQGEIPR